MQSKISFQCGRLAPLALALGLAVLPTFAQTGAQQSILAREHFQTVRERYQQQSWPASALRDGLAISMELEGWRAGPLQAEAGHLSRSFSAADSESPSFLVESLVGASTEDAHEQLVTWLAGVQSPRRMPTAREFGFEVGDVAFVGPSGAGPKAISWVGFTRANIAVRVMAFDPRANPSLDLGSVARAIDARIVARPALAPGTAVPRPRIVTLAAPTYTAVAGNEIRLDVSVVDPRGGEPHLRWAVGGSGQGYVERGTDGAWYLHTTGPGSIELGLEVTASSGTVATRSIGLQVADD